MSVVITGLGAVGSYGCGRQRITEALAHNTLTSSEVDRSQGFHRPQGSRRAALASSLDLTSWVAPAAARRMSTPSKYAVAAARMAVQDAGLGPEEIAGPTVVILATAFGPTSFTEKLLLQVLKEGPQAASPFFFTECVANAPAAQIAIAARAVGPNVTLLQREAGPLRAVARAAAEVSSGRSSRALTGAVDEMPPVLHALLDRFEVLAKPDADGQEIPRPFDRRRSGAVAAEGSVVLLLEDEGAARARGARILARLRGAGMAFDATASRVGWGLGHHTLAQGLRRVLDRAGLTPQDVDLIVSGASGAIAGDRLEALTLKSAWGEAPLPPLVTPKSVTGEYGGGFLAAAVLAASGARFGTPNGSAEPDPALDLCPSAAAAALAPQVVLATSLAAGGAASWLVLERP